MKNIYLIYCAHETKIFQLISPAAVGGEPRPRSSSSRWIPGCSQAGEFWVCPVSKVWWSINETNTCFVILLLEVFIPVLIKPTAPDSHVNLHIPLYNFIPHICCSHNNHKNNDMSPSCPILNTQGIKTHIYYLYNILSVSPFIHEASCSNKHCPRFNACSPQRIRAVKFITSNAARRFVLRDKMRRWNNTERRRDSHVQRTSDFVSQKQKYKQKHVKLNCKKKEKKRQKHCPPSLHLVLALAHIYFSRRITVWFFSQV